VRVLVTGHEGYIGAVLVPMLHTAGYEAVGLDTGFYVGCDFGPAPEPVATIGCDLRDVTRDDLVGIDAVVHLAAISNDPVGHLNPDTTYEINAYASIRLAEVAKAAGVRRFLFSSSCSLYGAAGDAAVDEASSFNPVTPYGRSKIIAEEGIHRLADPSFSPVSLRNATAYGISPRLRGDIVINNLVGWAHTTGEVRLQSDGRQWRPLVHVRDIAKAFVALLGADRDAVHDEAFNVGRDDNNLRIREVAELVQGAVPGSRVTFAPGAGTDARDYRVDFAKLRMRVPAAAPDWTVEAGIHEVAAAYTAIGLTLEDLSGPRFTRLARINELKAEGRLDDNLRWVPTGSGGAPAAGGLAAGDASHG
jgi:nucleoside-diphosphate-sugar epimerase